MSLLYKEIELIIITVSRLKKFWEDHPDSEQPLRSWVDFVKNAQWKNPNEVKQDIPDADNVGNKRMVFNIKGNKYRLVVMFLYEWRRAYIRFINTHKEYDKINDIKNI